MEPNCFIIRPKIPADLLDNEQRETAKKRIEMIPFDRPNFEFISFIDFCIFTQNEYFVFQVDVQTNKSVHVEMFKRKISSFSTSSRNFYFFVDISYNFSVIKVYMKYHITDFKFQRIDNIPCLKFFHSNQDTTDFMQMYIKPSEDTLLSHVAKHFLNAKHKCPDCILSYFHNLMNTTCSLSNFISGKYTKNIMEILNTVPGYISIIYQNQSLLNPKDSEEIQTLTIIYPWAVSTLKSIHYLEVDGSFDGMSPYVYCCVQGILFNESIPIAITIAPTECLELYKVFFDTINQLTKENPFNWNEFVVCSDMHSAIKSICKSLGIIQYFCHRHLLQHFGSSCSLALFANRLLKCFSLDQYIVVSADILKELEEFENERSKIAPINHDFQLKIDEIRIMASFEDCDHDSDYYYIRWALWIRRTHHVGRCSNHNESLHCVINRTLNSHNGLPRKLFHLVDTTLKHYIYLEKRHGGSIQRKINDYKQLLIKLFKNPTFDIFEYTKEECFCQEDLYNSLIYGTNIPCRHQILLKAKPIMKMVNDILKSDPDSVSLNDLVKEILMQRNLMKVITEDRVEILKNTLQLAVINTRKKINLNNDVILQLYNAIQSCLMFDQPPMPNIDLNWNVHILKEEKSNEYIAFKKKETQDFHRVIEIPNEDKDTLISENQSDAKKKAKFILFQTIKELMYVYPKMKDTSLAYSICFDQYLNYISFLNDDEIYLYLPKFKIECWKNADIAMNDKRFFK